MIDIDGKIPTYSYSMSSFVPGQLALMSDEAINLGGGMPNANYFPFEKSTMSVCDGTEITVNPKQMREALQYGFTNG